MLIAEFSGKLLYLVTLLFLEFPDINLSVINDSEHRNSKQELMDSFFLTENTLAPYI